MPPPRLVLFCRWPEPGKAKTRLIPALGAQGAAALHRQLAEATIATLRASGLALEIRFTGGTAAAFRKWLGEDLVYTEQGGGDLGARMLRAADPGPAILVGADCPDLRPDHIAQAAAALEKAAVVIGPAVDGVYWLLGVAEPWHWLFADIDWGTDRVLSQTLAELSSHDIEPMLLDILADCDRPEDLARWPDLAR